MFQVIYKLCQATQSNIIRIMEWIKDITLIRLLDSASRELITFTLRQLRDFILCHSPTYTHIISYPTDINICDVALGEDLDQFCLWLFVVIPERRVTVYIRILAFVYKNTIVWDLKSNKSPLLSILQRNETKKKSPSISWTILLKFSESLSWLNWLSVLWRDTLGYTHEETNCTHI